MIVDLLTENGLSVCLVSERWIIDDRVYYPIHGSYKTHKALISHEEPDDSYKEYEFVLRKICGLYLNFWTICKTGYLCLAYYLAEDYSAARALLKLAVEETDLSTDVEPKRKRRTPDRPSPSPIRKAKNGDRRPMTVIHSAAFEMFNEDITGINRKLCQHLLSTLLLIYFR